MRRTLWLTLSVGTALLGCAHPAAVTPAAPTPAPGPAAQALKPQGTAITGRLLGSDGQPLKLAHVHLGSQSVAAGPDGRFTLVTEASGFARLLFTGVDHASHPVGVLLDGREVRLDVRLGTNDRPAQLQQVSVVTPPAPPARPGAAVPMKRQPDGTFVAEVDAPAGPFAYELTGLRDTGSVNGTQADRYEYDGDGDYRSVVQAKGGKLVLVFDPARLPPAGRKPQVSFADPARTPLAEIAEGITERQQALREAVFEAMKQGQNPSEAQRAFFASHPWASQLEGRLEHERDPALRRALLVARFDLPLDGSPSEALRALASEALETIPPESTWWSLGGRAALNAAAILGGDKARAFLDAFAEQSPNRDAVAGLYFDRLREAATQGKRNEVHRYIEILKTRFPGTPEAMIAPRFSLEGAIQRGRPMPDFSFGALGESAQRYTPATFAGKTYLVAFWASWCKPCIAELPVLHALHQKYQARGFDLLSVAIHDDEADVKKFRKEHAAKWPMPWPVAYVGKDQADEVAKMFGVTGLPTALLVGPDGAVIATNVDVDGEGLEHLVDRIMSKPASAPAPARAAP